MQIIASFTLRFFGQQWILLELPWHTSPVDNLVEFVRRNERGENLAPCLFYMKSLCERCIWHLYDSEPNYGFLAPSIQSKHSIRDLYLASSCVQFACFLLFCPCCKCALLPKYLFYLDWWFVSLVFSTLICNLLHYLFTSFTWSRFCFHTVNFSFPVFFLFPVLCVSPPSISLV